MPIPNIVYWAIIIDRRFSVSAIATSYKITEASLAQGLELLNGNEYQKFWAFMKTHEVSTLPYSGYVLAAVIPFVQQRGIELPNARRVTLLSNGVAKRLGILVGGQAADYQVAAKSLAELQATDSELRQYYNDLYGHDWDEAATAMREGFAFIQQGIKSLNSEDELLMFSIR